MIRLILVRHAEAEGNVKRCFQGWTDGELTEKGRKQAELLGERFRDIPVDLLYSSSLKRTMETARAIAKVKNLPIIRTDRLKEINGGDWENIPWCDLAVRWPHENQTWEHQPHLHQMPNGESMKEFQNRVVEEIHRILSGNDGKNICVVTHGTAIRVLICYFYGFPLERMTEINWYDNTSVTIADYENNKFNVILEGDTSHLGTEWGTLDKQKWWLEAQKQKMEAQRKRMEAQRRLQTQE